MGKRGPKTEAGLQAVRENAKQLDHAAWTKNPKAVEAIEKARRMRMTKHGLYASVPIICKGHACPYAETCPLLQEDLAPYGEKCPLEIAAIEDLFQRYCDSLDIDPTDSKNTVDLLMVKDLVDADIALLRCDNKIAIDADYIINQVVGMTEEGEAMTRQELHPLTEYKEKLIARKNKTLQLLNSTRKDKEGKKLTIVSDPSERAAQMMKVLEDMNEHLSIERTREKEYYEKIGGRQDVIDVDPIDFSVEEEK